MSPNNFSGATVTLFFAMTAFAALAAHPGSARAQEVPQAPIAGTARITAPAGVQLDPELASIRAAGQSAASTGQVTGILFLTSLLTALGAVGSFAASEPCISFGGGCGGSGRPGFAVVAGVLALGSVGTFAAGLISLVVWIVQAADAAIREGSWNGSHPRPTSWRIEGGPGDLGVALSRDF